MLTNTRVRASRLLEGLALLLGHASVLWGVGVAFVYVASLVVLVSQGTRGTQLPATWPAIGLAVAFASNLVGWAGGEGPPRSAWIGGLLNLLGLAAVGWLMLVAR